MGEIGKSRELDELLSRMAPGEPPGVGAPDDVRALAELAGRVQRALDVQGPTESFAAITEARLLNLLRSQRPAARRSAAPRAPRRSWAWRPALAGLAVVVALLAAGTGAAYAAEGALPGEALYPVKRGIERVRLALSNTPQDETELMTLFAGRRLGEAHALIAAGLPDEALRALAEYESSVDALLALAGGLPAEAAGPALQQLDEQLNRHDEILEQVGAQLPEQARDALEQARERSAHGREAIRRLREGEIPSGGPPVAPPGLSSPDDEDVKGEGPPWGEPGPPGGEPPHGPPPWVTPGPPFLPFLR